MLDAQGQAFFDLARERGLLEADALQKVEAYQRSFGGGESAQEAAVRAGVLEREQLRALEHDLKKLSFACAGCRVPFSYEQLIAFKELVCQRCDQPLKPVVVASGVGHVATGAFQAVPKKKKDEKTLGPYTILKELGRGSMGVVYLARRAGLERRFALKVLNATFLEEETVQRFKLEAAIASKLEDRGVVGVFDVGRDGSHYYYAMEYCPGPTLKEHIRERGQLDPEEAASLIQQVARTIHFAHERKVIHRDLKPANIILETPGGRPRITDFGLARDRSLISKLTQTGEVLGTPYYMAPEQFRGADIDHRIDVYALGVILYEALTGQKPFDAATPEKLCDKVNSERAIPPRTLRPELPETLETICLVAMARSRADRYMSAEALAEDLEAFQRGEQPSHASGILSGEHPTNPAGVLALGTVAVIVGLAAVVLAIVWPDLQLSAKDPTRVAKTEPVDMEGNDGEGASLLDVARQLGARRAPFEETLKAYERAEKAAPKAKRAGIQLNKAEFFLRRGRWKEAQEAVRDLVDRTDEAGFEALRIRAEALSSEGRRQQARAVYQELARVDPKGVRGLTGRVIARRLGQSGPKGLQAAARQAYARDPTYVPALVELTFHMVISRQGAEARSLLREALSREPDCPRLLFVEALRLAIDGAAARGLSRLEEALGLMQSAELPFLMLHGILLTGVKRYDEAIKVFDQTLARREDYVEALIRRGEACWLKGRKEWSDPRWKQRASQDWKRAFKLDPKAFELSMGAFSPHRRDHMRAVVGSERAIKRETRVGRVTPELRQRMERRAARAQQPGREPLLQALLAAAGAQSWDALRPLFRRAREAAPRCRVVALEWARVCVGREAYQEGFAAIKRARRLGSPSPELDRMEGELWWDMGKGHKAAPIFEQLWRRDKGIEGLCAKALFYVAHGKRDKAVAAIERAVRFDPGHIRSLCVQAGFLLAKGPGKALKAFEMTTRALEFQGALDCRLLQTRINCMEILAIFDPKKKKPRRTLPPALVQPIIDAYERVFPLAKGPGPELGAAGFVMMLPPKNPLVKKAGVWLKRARAMQPGRGMTHLMLGRYGLATRASKEHILGHWRKAREVEPRILYPEWYFKLYEKRFGPSPELAPFRERLAPSRE